MHTAQSLHKYTLQRSSRGREALLPGCSPLTSPLMVRKALEWYSLSRPLLASRPLYRWPTRRLGSYISAARAPKEPVLAAEPAPGAPPARPVLPPFTMSCMAQPPESGHGGSVVAQDQEPDA